MEKISITRALVEKKLLGKRISQHLSKFQPLAVTLGDKPPTGFKSIEDFDKNARADLDQLRDELKRYDTIVQAIADSNAKTMVQISGKTYSVARALEKKKFYADIMDKGIYNLSTFLTEAENFYNKTLLAEKEKEDKEFENFIGRDKSFNKEELELARKVVASRHSVTLVDPLGLRKIIEELSKERADFMADVDIALTESNSRTEIDI